MVGKAPALVRLGGVNPAVMDSFQKHAGSVSTIFQDQTSTIGMEGGIVADEIFHMDGQDSCHSIHVFFG